MGHINVIGAMEEELAGLRAVSSKNPQRDGFAIRHSGVGKVNAALAVARAHQWDAQCVISVGTAGALDPDRRIGDVVIVNHAVQHDVDASPVGFPRGTIPFESESTWHADQSLVRIAAQAADDPAFLTVVSGICSGERFIADAAERAWLREHFNGSCIDMETGAIAQACAKLGVPWVGIRVISDRADCDASADFKASLALASHRIAQIVPKVVSLLIGGR